MSYLLSTAILKLATLSDEDLGAINEILEARLVRHLYGKARAKVLPREVIDTVGEDVGGGPRGPLANETPALSSPQEPAFFAPGFAITGCEDCDYLRCVDRDPRPCELHRGPEELAACQVEAEPPTERSP